MAHLMRIRALFQPLRETHRSADAVNILEKCDGTRDWKTSSGEPVLRKFLIAGIFDFFLFLLFHFFLLHCSPFAADFRSHFCVFSVESNRSFPE
jgi:hypothetical protein